MLAMTIPAPPGAITRPNSSRTRAVPTRSTARMAATGAIAGDRPAVWTTWWTGPRASTASASAATDGRELTSTCWVTTVWPASVSGSAADWSVSSAKSASRTVFPGPWRRAIAWPLPPAPITTITSWFVIGSPLLGASAPRSGGLGRGQVQLLQLLGGADPMQVVLGHRVAAPIRRSRCGGGT